MSPRAEPDRLLAVWHTPLKIDWPFAPIDGGHEFEPVFTYTLVLPGVAWAFAALRPRRDLGAIPGVVTEEFVTRSVRGDYTLPLDEEHVDRALEPTRLLAEQIGYFELERLARDLSPDVDAGALAFGNPRFGGAPIPSKLATAPVPPERLRAFVAAYGATLGKLAADQQFARLARDVAAAASSEARFPTGRAQFAADLWNRYTSKPYPRMEAPLRRFAIATGRRKLRGWAHAPETLLSRILLEADQLVFERPRLQLCGLCGRPFVPFAREAHCHGHLWSRNSRRLRALCERHVPFTVTARRKRTEHERKRDRSYQQILRWNRHLESSDDPDERKRLEKLIADLTAERAGELKRRGPSTTRPVVTEEADRTKGDTDGIASGST